jgi:hypothetical protein
MDCLQRLIFTAAAYVNPLEKKGFMQMVPEVDGMQKIDLKNRKGTGKPRFEPVKTGFELIDYGLPVAAATARSFLQAVLLTTRL